MKKSIKYFDDVLKTDESTCSHVAAWAVLTSALGPEGVKKFADALFGKVQYLQTVKKEKSRALELINQAVVNLSSSPIPALIEQAKAHLSMCNWDQALEASQRCLDIDASCIDALRIKVLHILARSGKGQEVWNSLGICV